MLPFVTGAVGFGQLSTDGLMLPLQMLGMPVGKHALRSLLLCFQRRVRIDVLLPIACHTFVFSGNGYCVYAC